MENQSKKNIVAWNYRAYEFWNMYNGNPEKAGKHMVDDPAYYIGNHLAYLGDVKGKRILNALGSNGRRAVPLTVMGADVTVIDISEENERYAREIAHYANVEINYIVSELLSFRDEKYKEFFDIAYLEGGIMHYFNDLNAFFRQLQFFLKKGGKLVLNDSHPVRKIINFGEYGNNDVALGGNYFDSELKDGPVAYEGRFPEYERKDFPKCLLRFWTLSEILNALADNKFCLRRFDEEPNMKYNWLPGPYTLVAYKME